MNIPGRPIPTTFEYVEALALREPRRLALVQDHQSWTYQALHSDLVRLVRVLHSLGVKRGDRVAVGTQGLQAGLALLIAAENLGAVTTCFLPEKDPDAQAVFGLVDWVFSDLPQSPPATVRNVLLDAAFVARLQAVAADDPTPLPRVALALDEPQRISRTSGSSGRSKFMLLKRQAQEHWVRTGAENGGYRPESRLLVAGPLVMNAIFARASACLRMGAAVLDLSRSGLAGHEITHILALPALLEEVLKSLPAGYAPRNRVEVQSIGGFVPPHLREKATRVFGGRLSSRYGANETTGICDDLDADGVGVVSPGVDLRILDEQGRELPLGRLGVIAVRTPGMVEGYIGDEEATRQAFRDGWFVSGDWGTLVAPRMLRLAGRYDDLLVVGGLKVPANEVETQARDMAGATDCAAFAVNLEGGDITLGIALVVPPSTDRAAARARIEKGLQVGASTNARILFLDAIPRMGNGKIDRVALHRLFESPPAGSL
ncbi:class I adenylate-forming enzyme family protein [Ramlibacter sp. PS4R-6]|uniref:class I adenylate-forming enzyme family protein n=1 Tax=Ramlibacter sp. PS4R-6 TaxID=3133438 RepID=UPI0030A1DD53